MSLTPTLSFGNLPAPVRIALGLLGGGGGAALTFALFGPTGVVIFLCGAAAVGLLLLLYAAVLRLIRKRRAASFAESVQSQSAQSPTSLNKAEQLAKLDDLRRKFEEGIDIFRRAGKDFYSVPWYLLIGESGSGKTEAMRRSGVGFPSGVQDYLQGVGGTINMHWWFTNHAVVLDLAGRVVFGEVASGAGSEWETFLRLLKRHRPTCPINGLLLVIPAKSLIRDAPEEMVRKAQRIAEQINRVQRLLDVRFPVFVMVTMCDLVTGFREFFEPLRGNEEQQQMLGWSNPQPIDAAFRTEMTEQYLSTVVARLTRWRQVMLRDPTPQRDLSDSRFDEVDALFKLPDSFSTLSATLKLYLQTIFVPTEWAAKPPFLRGIYFTSSMQEGAALDVELAKALGLPPEKLPEDGIWKRERALFLRDLFIDKVFQEKGLVSRASNVQQQYRRRKLALLGAAAAAAVLLLSLTWLGGRTLEARIGRERDLWKLAAEKAEADGGRELRVVAPRAGAPGAFEYLGALPLRAESGEITLAGLYGSLLQTVQKPLAVPRIFRLTRPFDAGFDERRRAALRAAFEAGVLQPLLAAARERLLRDEGAWTPQATAALAALLRVQADGCGLEYAPQDRLPKPADLDGLFRYILADADYARYAEKDRRLFDDALVWCYKPQAGGGTWPPAWLPRRPALADDPALRRGVERFAADCVRAAGDLAPQLERLRALAADVRLALGRHDAACRAAEAALVGVLEERRDKVLCVQGFEAVRPAWEAREGALSNCVAEACRALEGFSRRRSEIPLCNGENVASNYFATLAQASNRVAAAGTALALPREPEGAATNVTLVADVRLLLAQAAATGLTVRADAELLRTLDGFAQLYATFDSRVQLYARRLPDYGLPLYPPDLALQQSQWRERRLGLQALTVRSLRRAHESFCGRVLALCKACQQASNEVAVAEALAQIGASAQNGLQSLKSEALLDDSEKVLESWLALPENAAAARQTLRALEPARFLGHYFLERSRDSEDYWKQYWQDLALGSLRALANEVEPEVARLWQEMRKLARFPLSGDVSRGPALTLQELARARELLDALGAELGAGSKEVGRTIGEGARSNQKWLDDPLNRLCNAQQADLAAWVQAARAVCEGLPDDPLNKKVVAAVALEPADRQRKFIQESGLSERDSACVEFENCFISADEKGSLAERLRIGEGAPLTTVSVPGPSFTLWVYRYGEKEPVLSERYPAEAPWALLALLREPLARRDAESPLKWHVPFTLKRDGERRIVLWLQVETAKPFPPHNAWPGQAPN